MMTIQAIRSNGEVSHEYSSNDPREIDSTEIEWMLFLPEVDVIRVLGEPEPGSETPKNG
jgi:hypothetical protein